MNRPKRQIADEGEWFATLTFRPINKINDQELRTCEHCGRDIWTDEAEPHFRKECLKRKSVSIKEQIAGLLDEEES